MSRWTAQATRIVVRIANRAHCSATVRSASGVLLREVFPEAREQRCWVHKNCQRAGCGAVQVAAENDSSAAHHHERGEPRRSRPGDRLVRGELWREIRQGEAARARAIACSLMSIP